MVCRRRGDDGLASIRLRRGPRADDQALLRHQRQRHAGARSEGLAVPRLERRHDLDHARHAEQPDIPLPLPDEDLHVANPAAYRYYRLNITANNGAKGTHVAELGLFTDQGRTALNGVTMRSISNRPSRARKPPNPANDTSALNPWKNERTRSRQRSRDQAVHSPHFAASRRMKWPRSSCTSTRTRRRHS